MNDDFDCQCRVVFVPSLAAASYLQICVCVCVCVAVSCSSDWLFSVCVCMFSECSASMSSESRCHVWFDRRNKTATGPFSPLNPSGSVGPAALLHRSNIAGATVIGVDSLNEKSLHYTADILIGSYREGCREPERTRLMFGVSHLIKSSVLCRINMMLSEPLSCY